MNEAMVDASGTGTGTAAAATGCTATGESCRTREAWPLHHVKHQGGYLRLCTACVLKYHPSLFCSLCLDLIDPSPNPPNHPTIHCSSCHNVCHASCLPPSSSSDFFLCPSCSSSATASAAAAADSLASSSRRRTLDLPYARSLLCAARLSAQSMTRAAAAARADADRKAKEAAAARKRAREMLERVAAVAKSFRDKDKDKDHKDQEPREKDPSEVRGKAKWGLGVPVGPGGRERDKWMRLYEMPTPFHDSDKPLPGTLPKPPAAKFEQDDAKDTVARKPSAVLPSSGTKGTPSS
ncbi:Transcription factor bHLH131 [Rhynchospora pubera]|uniref:Transcription factor bHLH131 n=1 Tax=Rhynchospora pubera TaxID=906938 RepID=A0AAV8F9W8_9POAL|nr:Transcription factor bHLH131 [Rhynchospora pubera]